MPTTDLVCDREYVHRERHRPVDLSAAAGGAHEDKQRTGQRGRRGVVRNIPPPRSRVGCPDAPIQVATTYSPPPQARVQVSPHLGSPEHVPGHQPTSAATPLRARPSRTSPSSPPPPTLVEVSLQHVGRDLCNHEGIQSCGQQRVCTALGCRHGLHRSQERKAAVVNTLLWGSQPRGHGDNVPSL